MRVTRHTDLRTLDLDVNSADPGVVVFTETFVILVNSKYPPCERSAHSAYTAWWTIPTLDDVLKHYSHGIQANAILISSSKKRTNLVLQAFWHSDSRRKRSLNFSKRSLIMLLRKRSKILGSFQPKSNNIFMIRFLALVALTAPFASMSRSFWKWLFYW